MPSKSKAQQRFMGLVHAYKKGDVPASKVTKSVKDAAKSMSKKDTEKYASTKHKGLPNKVTQEWLKKTIRELVDEELNLEGTCGYGEDGVLGDEPAGPHLLKKKKNESASEKEKIFKILVKRGDNPIDARHSLDKVYDFIKKAYRRASAAKKAEIVSSLSKYESKQFKKVVVSEGIRATKAYNQFQKSRINFLERWGKLKKQLNTLKTESPNDEYLRLEKQLYKFETSFIENSAKMMSSLSKISKSNLTESFDRMEMQKLQTAIKMFQNKIKKQGRITNARDEEHLKNLIKIYKQMGGKGIRESYTSNMMRDIRKGGTAGPWTIIVSKNNSIKRTTMVKNLKEIPAYMSDIKKKFPNHKIGIESKGGKIVYRESINEASVSQVRSTLSRVKKQLMKKWAKKGGYENFGQKELRALKSKFKENPYGSPQERQISKMLDAFDNWAMNYSGDMKESINEEVTKSKGVQKIFDIQKNGYGKLGGRTLDSLSAGLFTQLYDKASDPIKEKMNKLNEKRLYIVIGNMWKKFGKNVSLR